MTKSSIIKVSKEFADKLREISRKTNKTIIDLTKELNDGWVVIYSKSKKNVNEELKDLF